MRGFVSTGHTDVTITFTVTVSTVYMWNLCCVPLHIGIGKLYFPTCISEYLILHLGWATARGSGSRSKPVSQNTAPAPNIGLSCMKKDRIDVFRYMKTGILEGSANDRPNYDVTWTINAAAITKITCQPRPLHRPPKYR